MRWVGGRAGLIHSLFFLLALAASEVPSFPFGNLLPNPLPNDSLPTKTATHRRFNDLWAWWNQKHRPAPRRVYNHVGPRSVYILSFWEPAVTSLFFQLEYIQ